MSRFGSKEEIIKSIENLFAEMQNEKLSLEHLESLVEQTRELYERSLVLRYKAYEEKIFGEIKQFVPEEKIDSSTSTIYSTEDLEIKEEEQIETKNSDLFATQEAVFDFDVFNEAPNETITNGIEEEIENEEIINLNENENFVEEIRTEINEISSDEFEASLEENEIENEEILSNQFDSLDKQNFEENSTNYFETNQQKTDINQSFDNSLKETENTIEAIQQTNESVFKKILEADNSLGSILMSSRLDTLIGAFGFNEKMQCIQELFKGSSEDFNQAIDILDNLSNFDEAQNQLEFYLRLNNWDLENAIVADFVRKIQRRFR